MAKRIRAEKVRVFADSQLVVRQVSGEYEVKDPSLKAYNRLVKQLWQKFSQIQVTQIPREENSRADELSRVNSDDLEATRGILIEILGRPNTATENTIMIIEALDWRSPIIEYLKSPTITAESESAKLRIRAARYILIDDVLYKKSFSLPYLRCLGSEEAQYALREIHEGICVQHIGGRSLSYKALRQGYYWPTMKKDSASFVQNCDKCQRFAKTTHQPPEELSNFVPPWPFVQ